MPATLSNSPVAKVLSAVLEATQPNFVARRCPNQGDERFLVCSYSEDFNYLWNIPDSTISGPTVRCISLLDWVIASSGVEPRSIVLVWDGLPSLENAATNQLVNIENYVTPIDWALAFSWKITNHFASGIQKTSSQSKMDLPNLSILILDLDSQNHPSSYACRKLPVVKAALPWLHFYRPISLLSNKVETLITAAELAENELVDGETKDLQSALRAAIPLGALDAQTLIEDILSPTRILSLSDAYKERNLSGDVEELVELWRDNLTRPGERHTIGNVLAPIMLVKGLPTELRDKAENKILGDKSLRTALKELVDTVGLKISEELKSPVSPQGLLKQMRDESDIFGKRQYIKFLLVDDQYSSGYQHILSYLLFGDLYTEPSERPGESYEWRSSVRGRGELRCVSKPNILFDALKYAKDDGRWNLPRYLDVPDCDVLLLDLRLWTDKGRRKQILNDLLGLCSKLRAASSKMYQGLFFDPAFEEAHTHASEIVKGSTRHSEIEALALLPLLLSYCDPSLPIVLFSSTHQRELLEMVSHRSNIITTFTKPILSGYGENKSAYRLIDNLHKALKKAVHLHEASWIWKEKINKIKDWGRPLPVTGAGENILCNIASAPAEFEIVGQEPRCKKDELQEKLAIFYINYIQRENYFDFASLCWELIEESFVPDKVLGTDYPTRFRLAKMFDKRSYVGLLANELRNKKTHGFYFQSQNKERQAQAMLLFFIVFLDFVEGKQSKYLGGIAGKKEELSKFLKRKYYGRLPNGYLSPFVLSHMPDIEDADFIAYAACDFANNSIDEQTKNTFFSQEAIDAIKRFAKYVITSP